MHNGRTIEELIKLVQRINTERGDDPNALHINDSNSTRSSLSSRSSHDLQEPAWLAVFQ